MKWHSTPPLTHPTPYNKHISKQPMRLHTSATQIDFYPVGTGKRFVKRVIWHKGAETELTSFSTRDRIGMKYDVEGYIANGATVSDFNLNEYTGKDYSPVYC